jgi:tetratricopeptide (TPR) repeat protein
MPSHIFTRVGLWDESIASNRRSAELAASAESTSANGEARDQRLHAMDYMEYAYLQSGRLQQAKAVLDEMNALPPVPGLTLTGEYALAAVPARHAIELRNWEQASGLTVRAGVSWAQALTWLAIGEGRARSNQVARAAQAEQALASLRDQSVNNPYWSNQIEVQRREVAAWILRANGKSADALRQMRSAAELEESMDKHAVTPGAVTPAREMLAEMLMLEKQPSDALAEYQSVLKVAPNRFNALYGAASAADAAGNALVATQYFQKLLEVAVGDERPEMTTARKKVAFSARN